MLVALTKDEEDRLKKSLLDFVLRISSPDSKASPCEMELLPKITEILLTSFRL